MSTEFSLLIMFLLLTYLLFRRSAAGASNATLAHRPNQTPAPGAPAGNRSLLSNLAVGVAVIQMFGAMTFAQTNATANQRAAADIDEAAVNKNSAAKEGAKAKDNEALLDEMRRMIEKLEARVNQLEAEKSAAPVSSTPASTVSPATIAAPGATPAPLQAAMLSEADRGVLDFWRDTTVNLTLDGYYGYNFNRPVGRINLLRAYDVQSNSFTVNQATLVIERAPDVEAGRRFGARLDLMFGQATETVQGNAATEPRPQVYRHIWQAYGTYVAPVGKGLTVDFGKFASSLGYEGNYNKDQINYSRSYWFNFLPYYHTGFRSNYAFNEKFNVTHYFVNGIGQSEDFNGFKSQAVLLNIKPVKNLSWNVNYYTGLEGRDLNPALNPGLAPLPTQPGLSTDVIKPAPRGRIHIFDTYAALTVNDRLILVGEFDYVISRAQTFAPPTRVTGGAAYARYQFTPKFALAGRAEYLSDRGGLFSGVTQALKETTLTAEYKFDEGLLMRAEWRRDFTNQPFFLTNAPGVLKREQNTATLGFVWWFGRKQGGW